MIIQDGEQSVNIFLTLYDDYCIRNFVEKVVMMRIGNKLQTHWQILFNNLPGRIKYTCTCIIIGK